MPFNRPIPEPKRRSKLATGVDSLVQAEKLLQIAFVLPAATVIGWVAGAWADDRFHQSWMGIFGIIFGSISGLVYVVRLAMDAEKGSISDSKSRNKTGKGTSNIKQ
ncbi:MAG: AtpZ/AtpI family protein [Terracidiphilus sp.]